MISHDIKILNRYGIHARPSSMISELANSFKSKIVFQKDGRSADAKSVMDLILLCIEPGSTITLVIEGQDEQLALDAFIQLIEVRKFDEENMEH